MKNKFLLASFLALLTPWPAQAADDHPSGITGHFNLYLGQKALDSDEWGDTDEQFAFGASFDFRKPSWPINLAAEYIQSMDSSDNAALELDSMAIELALGLRKYWEAGKDVELFLGGGPAILFGAMNRKEPITTPVVAIIDQEDSGAGVGLWAGGGALFRLGPTFTAGVTARYSLGDVEIFSQDRDAGGVLFAFLGGARF